MGNRVLRVRVNCKLFGAIRGSSVIWSGGAACLPTRSAGYGDEQGKGKSRWDIAIHRHGNFRGPVMGQHGLGEGFYRESCDISTRISTFSTRQQALWCPPRSLLLRARTMWWPPHGLLRRAQSLLLSARTTWWPPHGLLLRARSSWGAPHLMLLAAQSLLLRAQSPLPAAQSHLLPQPLPPLIGPPGRIARHNPRSRAAKKLP